MSKQKIKNNKKTKTINTQGHWYARSSRFYKPIVIGVAVAMFAGPASWLMVSAQSDAAEDASAMRTAGSNAAAKSSSSSGSRQQTAANTPATSGKKGDTTSKTATKSADKPKPATASIAAKPAPSPAPPAVVKPAPPAAPTPIAVSTASHDNIVSTIFWVGEAADASNANITNTVSSWDENWQAHFGGVDDPGSRNGYAPAAFVPKENPFYFALPYSDFDNDGNRRATAGNCPNAAALAGSDASWCKNAWIKISHAGKTTYAQWEDTGPLQENDTAYVFGNARPLNTWGAKAGIDVSPAVRDYLGLQDVDTVSWSFVSAGSVPAGPWKNVVTTSLGT